MQAHTCLGLAALGVGDLVAVRDACLAATATAAENGWQASVWSILANAVLGFTELQRAEPVEAGHIAAAALEACGVQTSPPLRFALQVIQGAAQCDCGHELDGLGAMQRARSELGDRQVTPALLAAAALLESRAALDLGHLTAARTVRGWLSERTSPCAEIELVRAWTAAAEGHGAAGPRPSAAGARGHSARAASAHAGGGVAARGRPVPYRRGTGRRQTRPVDVTGPS